MTVISDEAALQAAVDYGPDARPDSPLGMFIADGTITAEHVRIARSSLERPAYDLPPGGGESMRRFDQYIVHHGRRGPVDGWSCNDPQALQVARPAMPITRPAPLGE